MIRTPYFCGKPSYNYYVCPRIIYIAFFLPFALFSSQMGGPSHRNDYTSIYDQRCAAWGNEETIDLLYLWRDNLQAIQCARNRPAWEHVSHLILTSVPSVCHSLHYHAFLMVRQSVHLSVRPLFHSLNYL